jgi:kynurenine formamidase
MSARRLVDLSHEIDPGMITYRGLGSFPVRAYAILAGP